MPHSDLVLKEKSFWNFYFKTEDKPRDASLKAFVKACDFDFEKTSLSFLLPCPNNFSLEINIHPNPASITLSLVEMQTGDSFEMAWWDEAQFHPLALRWSELMGLYRFWKSNTGDVDTHVAVLLTSIFVGHPDEEGEQFEGRQSFLADQLGHLGLFNAKEINRVSERILIIPPDEDYQWSNDPELGWVLSGEYPCYSLRNAEHLESEDGLFPFDLWNSVVADFPKTY